MEARECALLERFLFSLLLLLLTTPVIHFQILFRTCPNLFPHVASQLLTQPFRQERIGLDNGHGAAVLAAVGMTTAHTFRNQRLEVSMNDGTFACIGSAPYHIKNKNLEQHDKALTFRPLRVVVVATFPRRRSGSRFRCFLLWLYL